MGWVEKLHGLRIAVKGMTRKQAHQVVGELSTAGLGAWKAIRVGNDGVWKETGGGTRWRVVAIGTNSLPDIGYEDGHWLLIDPDRLERVEGDFNEALPIIRAAIARHLLRGNTDT
jgi:hypothetical protein